MPEATLPCFSNEQAVLAHKYLAAQVATMMGRKFEEHDWAAVYCAAKGIPVGTWSNLNIDISFGNLGVEHKMICRKSDASILASCGTTIMHPAGTRSIRIPQTQDATAAAQDVLKQYGELIDARTGLVGISDRYHHGVVTREEAISEVMQIYPDMKRNTAEKRVPKERSPIIASYSEREPDMRTGWLLWQESLREFLYFEVAMKKPNPSDYYAEWADSGGGSRKKSRNLWVYERSTKIKMFSITTEAGAKLQPYFTVPTPSDKNLYHFIVQGERMESGVRVWLTSNTAAFLENKLGSLDGPSVSEAIIGASPLEEKLVSDDWAFSVLAVPIVVSFDAYAALLSKFNGVSDEHRMHLLLESLTLSDAAAI